MPELKIERVPLASLVPDPNNPRTHDDRNRAAIRASLERHGQVEPLVVQASSRTIIGGNGRYHEMLALGWTEADVVLLPIGDAQARRLSIELNRTGELAGWDAAILKGFSFEPEMLGGLFSAEEQDTLFAELETLAKPAEDLTYTSKIKTPIYTPKGEMPEVSALFDRTKTVELLAEIETAGLPDKLAGFLRLAAERHTAFNFRSIAEFYCHSTPVVQRLMEDSGLVIIDFGRAIENGFVKVTDRLGELADREQAVIDDAG